MIVLLKSAMCSLYGQTGLRFGLGEGLVIPEYQHFNSIVNKPLIVSEISLVKQASGKKNYWAQLYNFPNYGCTFQVTTLGNKTVLGNELALFPFIQFQLLKKHKIRLFEELGFGIGYATKRFDLETNYLNISIGSHLNAHFNFKTGISFPLNKTLLLDACLSFTHLSNANMAEPNIGINTINALICVKYNKTNTNLTTREIPPHEAFSDWVLIPSIGGKHARALQNKLYLTSSISAEYNRSLYRRFHIGFGLDGFFDSSTEVEMEKPEGSSYEPKDRFRLGAHFAQEFVYNRFSLIIQEGLYFLLKDEVSNSAMYNRAIARFRLSNSFHIQVAMKSHLHILEYPEIGIGFHLISFK